MTKYYVKILHLFNSIDKRDKVKLRIIQYLYEVLKL